ncbi:Flp family type IVb pilin [Sphingomonas sp. CL5.1]|uniref:Flp family type IVb pilin n=1 Tax=Sphingomonas sp. CL5.1 TaxID=2653203 RepID=UPI0015840DB0|nr:Flp family type IVb pilin [Sphingomonas sp. CL5.1]QKS01588.1 Flp family type IVb pilin [Sphingomonas sp. CL5.1]
MLRSRPSRTTGFRAFRARLLRDRRGATAVEYGLIVALIVIAMISSLTNLASVTTGMWNNVSSKVVNAQ